MNSRGAGGPAYRQADHWTFPGGGIPMVIISGINAAKLVLKSMKKFT